MEELVPAGSAEEIRAQGRKVVTVGVVPVLVLWHEGSFCAIDNRCPHMGFPLHQGDAHDGLLDCHWHHARFDISCGATLDPWADDVDCYRTEVKDGQVFIDPNRPPRDPRAHGLAALDRGLEHNIRLVIAKAVIEMAEGDVPVDDALESSARFGAKENEMGWRSGLTVLSAMANVHPSLAASDRPRALTKAFSWIAEECDGVPPRRPLPALAGTGRDRAGLCDWLRETVEVRDADGAERVLRTLVEEFGAAAALEGVGAACTDHRFCDDGHTLDFAVKCAELSDQLGDGAALLFTSLVPQLVQMTRSEETSAWRRPVDVAKLVAGFAAELPSEPFTGEPMDAEPLADEETLVELLLEDDPEKSLREFARRLRDGAHPVALADVTVAAATRRVLHFGTANEVPDWDTVHHTLSYANAVAEGLRRIGTRELFRGVFDSIASVFLDRFLNIPKAGLPSASAADPEASTARLLALYDQRASVDEAAECALSFFQGGGAPARLLETLGHVVLREDAGFHHYQQLDIAWRRLQRRGDTPETRLALVACARWLAAHYPTRRAQEQTYTIAWRLHRGEALYE